VAARRARARPAARSPPRLIRLPDLGSFRTRSVAVRGGRAVGRCVLATVRDCTHALDRAAPPGVLALEPAASSGYASCPSPLGRALATVRHRTCALKSGLRALVGGAVSRAGGPYLRTHPRFGRARCRAARPCASTAHFRLRAATAHAHTRAARPAGASTQWPGVAPRTFAHAFACALAVVCDLARTRAVALAMRLVPASSGYHVLGRGKLWLCMLVFNSPIVICFFACT
jgi:hypothetical protein